MSTKASDSRAFLRPRCIYTGKDFNFADPLLRPSLEHIIPLSLGGSDDFTTKDVSAEANARAGNEIDGEPTGCYWLSREVWFWPLK